MNQETLGVYSQTDGIVDQCKGYKCQQGSQTEQKETGFAQIAVHRVYKILRIVDFQNVLFAHQFLFDEMNTVRIGVVSIQLDFNGCTERIISQELSRISSHSFCLLFQSLILGDIVRLFHIRFLVQLLLKRQNVCFPHIVTEYH